MADDTDMKTWLAEFQAVTDGAGDADPARGRALSALVQAELPGLGFDGSHEAYVKLLDSLADGGPADE
ncbi:MAG: hypothetical protein OXR84_07480 [Magnetovibrio sp.]|nr:hypothetical protein [Magnetovibrio sp.]